MVITELDIFGAYIIDNPVFSDSRGKFEVFWEWNEQIIFHPDSAHHSYNPTVFTLRGMHYQENPFEQAKMVSCIKGSLYDVIVDLRPESPTYLQWKATELCAASGKTLYVPKGFAHGFLTLEPDTIVSYLIEGKYHPESSAVLRWNDPAISINWPPGNYLISDKDNEAPYYYNE